ALYACMPDLAVGTVDGRITAFDLDAEGSLSVWFSSITLALAGIGAVLVFSVRRHRTDDYHGHYRVWLWTALCCLLMSIDETASLHEGFAGMMTWATGTPLYDDGAIWWLIPYGFLLGAVGSRLLVDVRHSRLCVATMTMVAMCYLTAALVRLGWLMASSVQKGVMIEEGAEMLGNLFLLLGIGLFARHSMLDAEGLLPWQEPDEVDDEELEAELEEEEEEEEKPPRSRQTWSRADPPHSTPKPAKKRRTPATQETIPSPVARKLTKQERKALRKKLQRERMQHEREQRNNW
ncbi:MAG TPA: hypothetical protein VE890_01295, partial [Thermoguttaceae bacterium]|nr:hypothetical protein [Thermoguttaceae bacterium]